MPEAAPDPVVADLAHFGHLKIPLLEDLKDFRLFALLQHDQHALLAFGEQDFVGQHAGFAHGHTIQVQMQPGSATPGHFHRGGGEPGRTHVLDANDYVALHEL
jgi:hypothetical protein